MYLVYLPCLDLLLNITHAGSTGSSSQNTILTTEDFTGSAPTGWTTANYGSGNTWDISTQDAADINE